MIKEVLLTSICRPRQWKTISTKNLLSSGYPVYGANGKIGFYNKYTHENPTLLITCRGATCGTINISEPKSYVNGNAMALDDLSKEVDLFYLKNYLEYRKLNDIISGSAQPQITGEGLSKVKIPLPPIDTQKRISDILVEADKLRQLDKQLIEKYDDLAHSLFLYMFGDPIENSKDWQVRKLKDLCTQIGSGNTPKGGSKVYVEEGITFFRSQNVWRNRIELWDVAFINQATHDKMTRSSLKHKDILMTKTGRINTENSSLGRAAMYLGEDDKANVNGHVYLIRPKEDVINEFVLFILTTIQYRDYIRRVCVGGIDKRQLNKDHIEEFPIIYPPIESQTKFVEILKVVESQKALAQQSLQKSEDLFNSLLQKAFKGELI
ncbi:restriction endonuclease subunit S [Gelidibacter sp. F2691]|nr:restriction endonuclease subunit S [Gelidibacter sp. F2691]